MCGVCVCVRVCVCKECSAVIFSVCVSDSCRTGVVETGRGRRGLLIAEGKALSPFSTLSSISESEEIKMKF